MECGVPHRARSAQLRAIMKYLHLSALLCKCCIADCSIVYSFVSEAMANSQASDLMSIGTHCAFAGCGQLDFLPFKCDACQRTYCLEHRSYRAHSCPQASGKDTQVIVCPLCAKSIRVPSNDDEAVAEAFARHSATDCDPSNYQRVHNKKKCPVPGCKTKLTEANTYKCKKCGISVCMTHRFEKDHQCTGTGCHRLCATSSFR